jgi:hypothetical protein
MHDQEIVQEGVHFRGFGEVGQDSLEFCLTGEILPVIIPISDQPLAFTGGI